jgi:hypothetical protein
MVFIVKERKQKAHGVNRIVRYDTIQLSGGKFNFLLLIFYISQPFFSKPSVQRSAGL